MTESKNTRRHAGGSRPCTRARGAPAKKSPARAVAGGGGALPPVLRVSDSDEDVPFGHVTGGGRLHSFFRGTSGQPAPPPQPPTLDTLKLKPDANDSVLKKIEKLDAFTRHVENFDQDAIVNIAIPFYKDYFQNAGPTVNPNNADDTLWAYIYQVHTIPMQALQARAQGTGGHNEAHFIDEVIQLINHISNESPIDASMKQQRNMGLLYARDLLDQQRGNTGWWRWMTTRAADLGARARGAFTTPPLCPKTPASEAAKEDAAETDLLHRALNNRTNPIEPVHVSLNSPGMPKLNGDGCNMCEVIVVACRHAFTSPYRVDDATNDCRRLSVLYTSGATPKTVAVFTLTSKNLRRDEDTVYCQWVIYRITRAIVRHWTESGKTRIFPGVSRTIMFDPVSDAGDAGPGGKKSMDLLVKRIKSTNRKLKARGIVLRVLNNDIECDVGGNTAVIKLGNAMNVPKARVNVFVDLLYYVLMLQGAKIGNKPERYQRFLQAQVVTPLL